MEHYFAFQWHITDTCDQRCQHCYIFAEDNLIQTKEMSLDQMKTVLKNCEDMCREMNRHPYFYITGGDPILHKDFWTLLGLLKKREIPFTILGNPFHLNDEVCERLKSFGCERYQLSIDGLRDTHDAIRKPGSFDTTIEKIRCIRKAGIRSVIMTTVSNTNSHEVPEIINLVVENQVDVFAFARYCPTSFDKHTHMTPHEYRDLLEVCWNRFELYKDLGTVFNLKDHLWTLFLHEKGLFTPPGGLETDTLYDGCNCTRNHLTILPSGDVYACRRFDSKVGNVFKDRLYGIFTGRNMGCYRDHRKLEKCSKCELLRFCRGCPAVAYGYTGNYFAADPQCWKDV